MKKILAVLISVLLLTTVFVGCTSEITDTKDTFTIYAESGYLDEASIEKGFSDYYKSKTGKEIKTDVLFFEDTDKMMEQVKAGKVACDLILTKDYAAQTLINGGYTQGITDVDNLKDDIENFKNISKFITEKLDFKIEGEGLNPEFLYSVPFSFRTQGVLYNKKNVPTSDMGSLAVFADPKFKDKIAMTTDYRQLYALGAIYANFETINNSTEYIKTLSDTVNNFDKAGRIQAEEMLKELEKTAGYKYADHTTDLILNGSKDIALCWSNEAVKAITNNTNKDVKLLFRIPYEGAIIETNAFVMPKKANNKDEAKMFIDYVLQDQVSIEQMNYSGNTSVLSTKTILETMKDEAMIESNYSYFFGLGNNQVSLKNGYYPDIIESELLFQVVDMGENKKEVVDMIDGVVVNTVLIILLVVIGVIILGTVLFLIYFLNKISKQKSEKKEKIESAKGYRK